MPFDAKPRLLDAFTQHAVRVPSVAICETLIRVRVTVDCVRMRHVASAVVILSAGALIAHAQAARDLRAPTLPSEAITLRGRVLADDSGDPLTGMSRSMLNSPAAPVTLPLRRCPDLEL
jgi:hypothetical protein